MLMRDPAVSGLFYPADVHELRRLLETLARTARKPTVTGGLRGVVSPHAGLVYSGLTAFAAHHVLKAHADEYETIILIGPSHHVPFHGTITFPQGVWRMPFGSVRITPHPSFPQAVEPFMPEHSLEVQLPLLWWHGLLDKQIMMLLTGFDDPRRIAEHLWIPGSIILVSTDLSHYYPDPLAREIDSVANECIPRVDIPCVAERVEACGKDALLALLHVAKREAWRGVFLDYTTSADTAGSPENVVGYGAYAFTE